MPVTLERFLGVPDPTGGTVPGSVRRLNLGSGNDRRAEFLNLDMVALPAVDVVADIERSHLPFADRSFSLVLCQDVLEHVDIVPAMREIHRVLQPGGLLVLSAVHFTSRNLYVDPTHVRGFSVRTFDFFAETDHELFRPYYFDFAFRAVDYVAVQFNYLHGNGRYLVWERLVEPLVNLGRRGQDIYEMTFLSRLFPAANVIAVLRK